MRRSSTPGRPARLRRRLERAARDLNPYLVLLAIGLAMLNLTGFVLRLSHLGPSWSIHRGGVRAGVGLSEYAIRRRCGA